MKIGARFSRASALAGLCACLLSIVLVPSVQAQEPPFTNLSYGDYFNAIYAGDENEVRRLDAKYLAAVRVQLENYKRDPVLGRFVVMIDPAQITLLTPLMRAYVQDYEERYGGCLRPDAVQIRLRTIKMVGLQQNKSDAYYRVNKEFGDAFMVTAKTGPQDNLGDLGDLFSGGGVLRMTVATGSLMASYRCHDARIQRFEARLLELFRAIAIGKSPAEKKEAATAARAGARLANQELRNMSFGELDPQLRPLIRQAMIDNKATGTTNKITCTYGPFQDTDGVAKNQEMTFWYRKLPDDFAQWVANDPRLTLLRVGGMAAIDKCPDQLSEAQGIADEGRERYRAQRR